MFGDLLVFASDAMPFVVAVIGIVLSFKQPPEGSHRKTTVSLIVLGLIGSGITTWSHLAAERTHSEEMKELRDDNAILTKKLDLVKDQNDQILANLTPPASKAASHTK